jgi:hypothetical protein
LVEQFLPSVRWKVGPQLLQRQYGRKLL